MKTPIVLLVAACLMSFAPISKQNFVYQNQIETAKTTSIKWKPVEMDLGAIIQNKPVTVEFEFTNDGQMPVVISNVQASCGCTNTNFSKTPVLPGETSKITAVYNAATMGSFKKTLTVTSNAEENSKTLSISGTVIPVEAQK